MTIFINTPNEKRYIFYPASNGEFKFRICCNNDCHVALATQPHEALPMYEIAIGGWNNTKSIIRKFGEQPDFAAAATPNILNNNEMRGFWVRWLDNTISVGREGESQAFMSHKDPNLLPIKYVGICTAYGSTGSWLFDEIPINGIVPYHPMKADLVGSQNMKFVKTPNEKKYKYYPAQGEIFTFNVCCTNDCHISLSTHMDWVTPIYEIAIGGWSNSKSIIRLIGKEPNVVAAITPNIVNPNEMRGFWVSWDNNVIQVGRTGESVPFMSYKDVNLFDIKYVGICTAFGSTGTWLLKEMASAKEIVSLPTGILNDNSKLTSVNTPNLQKYIFYPARGETFSFKVRCSNDCHVSLSTNPQELLPMYVIVIGGWNNSKSVIRKIGSPPDLVEAMTPSIVNSKEYRSFWVCWYGNVIQVGRDGENVPFMAYKDENLFMVKYVGIYTAFGSTGSWLLDENFKADLVRNPSNCLKIETPKEKAYKFYKIHGERLNFKISCSHDCLLALSAQPLEGLPMYEIVIGGWGNTKSVIRQIGLQPAEVTEVLTPDILASDKLLGFWISWSNNTLSVGRAGESMSFMSHKDAKLFPITYVGISSGNGATGTWQFEDKTISPGNWFATSNGVLPPAAISCNLNDKELNYVARVKYNGNLIPGRLQSTQGLCYITYKGKVLSFNNYEVFVSGNASWAPVVNGRLPSNALVGGYTDDGELLYIGRALHLGNLTPGKVQHSKGCCLISHQNREIACPEYEVCVTN
ncbi:uncharacterized protein LOC106086465 [Stomoxys calcitrans]|uniref:uncharacterized protein LOC106086465 n=1 Tax=Stomoxys calcitrans TaxID=35570 RepID=UPI0027E25B55|nr:uncharacterized protein LOC106086465 [Stomoxys calcitrans]